MGNTRVLYERYIERDKSPERGDVNRDFEEITYEAYDRYCHSLDSFSVGGIVVAVDTTDFNSIDTRGHIDIARQSLQNQISLINDY